MTRALSFLLGLLLLTSSAQAQDLPTAPILRLDPGMHSAPIRRIGVDAKERFLVTGSLDKTVRVWSLEDGRLLQVLRVPIGEGDVGRVSAVAISPDGTTVAAGGWGPAQNGLNNSVYIFDRQTGRLKHHIDGLPHRIRHLAFSPDGHHLVATLGGGNGVRVFDTDDFGLVAEDTDYGANGYWAAFDAAGRLVTTSYDGQIRLYDAGFDLITSVEAPGGARPFGVAFSPGGERIAVGYVDSTRLDVLDGETLALRFEADTSGVDNGNLFSVAWSADGRFLYAGGIYVDPDGSNVLRRWADGGRGAYEDFALSDNTIMDLRPHAEGRLAFGATDPAFGLLAADGSILWRQGPTKADFRDQLEALRVSPDGTKIAFGYDYGGDTPAFFDLLSRRLTRDAESDAAFVAASVAEPGLAIEDWEDEYTPTLNGEPLPLKQYERSRSLAIAPDGERFLLGTNWYLRCFDRAGDELWSFSGPGVAWAVNISGDGRLAVAAYGDGTIRWYRLEDGEELLAFYPDRGTTTEEISEDNLRWVAWTPQGYYMASPGGEELIGWHINRGLDTPEFFGASRFRERFNRPDIVELVLEELDVEKAVARANEAASVVVAAAPAAPEPIVKPEDIIAAGLPPVIQITDPTEGTPFATEDVIVKYVMSAKSDEPPTVTALVNGEVVSKMLFTQKIEGDVAGKILVPLEGRVSGTDLVIGLIAESEHGASDLAEVKLEWGGAGTRNQPNLHVLAIGVSTYEKHDHLKLKYASKDAEDVATWLNDQEDGLYEDVKVMVLLDDEAGWRDIEEGFSVLRREAREGDVVMVFFSGHGATDGGTYYFLPHDVDVSTPEELRFSGYPEDRIIENLKSVRERGTKIVTFLDTCHSGDVIQGSKAGRPPDIDKVAAALAAAENGAIVFTSSTGTELSYETEELKNGIFTHALMAAFRGQADASRNGFVSVSELQGFLPNFVEELSGGKQRPKIYAPFKELFEAEIALVQE